MTTTAQSGPAAADTAGSALETLPGSEPTTASKPPPLAAFELPAVPLRPYQVEAARAIGDAVAAGVRRPVVAMATGLGKTLLGLAAARAFRPRGRTLWLAGREELVRQPRDRALDAWPGVHVGIVQAAQDEPDARDLVIASVPSVARPERLARVLASGPPALVVVDEAHHAAAETWRRALDQCGAFSPVGPVVLGLTATPERADGRGLNEVFEKVVFSLGLVEAIRAGFLAPPRLPFVRVKVEDLELEADERELSDARAAELVGARVERNLAAVAGATADAWACHAGDRKGLVFTCTIAQATATAKALRDLGIAAEALSGLTPTGERRAILARLKAGTTRVVANAAVLLEGFDEPTIDAVLLARPCVSKPVFMQAIGRATRHALGKTDWLLLDLAGASDLHSLHFAPLLDEAPQGLGPEIPEEPSDEGGSGPDRALPIPVAWVDVARFYPELPEGRVFAAGGGRFTVLLRREGDRWLVEARRRDRTSAALGSYADRDLAEGIGADAVRRGGGVVFLAARGSPWRERGASPAQLAAAASCHRAFPAGTKAGAVSDFLVASIARAGLRSRRGT